MRTQLTQNQDEGRFSHTQLVPLSAPRPNGYKLNVSTHRFGSVPRRASMVLGTWILFDVLCGGTFARSGDSPQVLQRPRTLYGWEDGRGEDDRIKTSKERAWDVVAARDDVEFYSTREKLKRGGPGDHTGRCSATPMKRFYVTIADRGDRALYLVEAKKTNLVRYIEIAKECGWVRSDSFLLVDVPLEDSKSGIRKKVITLFDWRTVQSAQTEPADRERVFRDATLYGSPVRDMTHRRGGLNMAEFAYVFKQVEAGGEIWFFVSATFALPAVEHEIERPDWGWVPATAVVGWDTAEAVWPDWYRERAAHVYKDQTTLLDAVDQAGSVDGIMVRDVRFDQTDDTPRPPKRPIGGMMPHPIANLGRDLKPCVKRLVECARVVYVGALAFDQGPIETVRSWTGDGQTDGPSKTRQLMVRGKTIMQQAASNVNVVFVVDGTRSFQPFIRSVTQAISRLAKEESVIRDVLDEGAKLRFGVVVYRDDYAGARRIVSYQLTEGLLDLAHRVAQERATTHDRDNYDEALFCGLAEAGELLGKVPGSQDHLNVIVTVGDRKSVRGRNCCPKMTDAVKALGNASPMMTLALGLRHADADLVGFESDVREVFALAGTASGVWGTKRFGKDESAQMARYMRRKIVELATKVKAYGRELDRCITGVGCEKENTRPAPTEEVPPEAGLQDVRGYRMTPIVRGITIRRLMNEEGLTEEEARDVWDKIYNRHATIHVTGWALLTDKSRDQINPGPTVMRKVVLFDVDGVHDYSARLKELLDKTDYVEFIQTWSDTCGRVSEESDVFSRGACDRFKNGITQVKLHPLLGQSREEIRQWFGVTATQEKKQKARKAVEQILDTARKVHQTLESHKNSDDPNLWFKTGGGKGKKHLWLLQEELL